MRPPTTATDRLDLGRVARGARTRFAPAPTGRLHLGHLVNAIYVWGVARAAHGIVVLRIEDHDRQRSRPAFDAALVADLAALGLEPDEGPVRQSGASAPYLEALDRLRSRGLVYACECSRTTYAAWVAAQGRAWSGPGCPGACRSRALPERPDSVLRVAQGEGDEAWDDLLVGPSRGPVSGLGDPAVRDRHGNWTYGFAVVVDDLRQRIDLVIRGSDLAAATPGQIRLARLLGRDEPPLFLHHPLIRKAGGAKLSKGDRDTAVGELLAAGRSPAELFGEAAAAVGLVPAGTLLRIEGLITLFSHSFR